MRLDRRTLRRAIYLLVLAAIVAFLYTLGAQPWVRILGHWPVSLAVMAITGFGIVVQTLSYESVVPDVYKARTPNRLEILRIWALSGAVSVAVPVFAGFGTRTSLLVHCGMPLGATLLTSLRQAWMGVEYALLLGAAAALFVDFSGKLWLASALFAGWGCALAFRRYAGKDKLTAQSRTGRLLEALATPVVASAHKWFLVQVLLMGATYYVAFHGFGAPVGWAEALLLATVTVLASLIVLVPNGLGVMDAIWVAAGMQMNMRLAQSVAFALTLRLSYLMAAALLWLAVSALLRMRGRNE